MSAVIMDTNEREGPAAIKIPEHGETSIGNRLAGEVPETKSEGTKERWAPDGYYWTRRNGKLVMAVHGWMIDNVVKEAEAAFNAARAKFNDSNECKELIFNGGKELQDYLYTRKAINDKAFARRLKQECDDASYQIVQAAKYKIDAAARIAQAHNDGRSIDDDKTIANLRSWANASLREGYILTGICMVAATDTEVVPQFDYRAAAIRVCNWSAQRLTESLSQRYNNDEKAAELTEEAAKRDLDNFFG